MKVYTHPTINLPCGAVVVKFYDDRSSESGSETTPDIITDIGDITEGFDFQYGELRLGDCNIKMHNKDNYVLGTLLAGQYARVSILIDNKNYFYGQIDFGKLPPIGGEDPDPDMKYSDIVIPAINILSRLKRIPIASVLYNLGTFDPVGPSWTSYYFLNELFRALAFSAKCAYVSGDDVYYNCERLFKYTDNGTGAQEVNLKDLIIKTDYFDTFDTSGFENNYEDNCDNALSMLSQLGKEFFFYPQITFDSTDFRLNIVERDNGTTITLPPVKKRDLAYKYLIRHLDVRLKNKPSTLVNTYLLDEYEKTYPEALYGDDIIIEQLHTNILDEDLTAVITTDGFLTTTESTMNVGRTDFMDDSGDAIVSTSGGDVTFHYTGKSSTTLTGCTVDSGSYGYNVDDEVRRADHSYNTNLILFRWDTIFGVQFTFTSVENPDAFISNAFQGAIGRATKKIYYDATKWREFTVHGLKADLDMDKLAIGYQFIDSGNTYLIHEVTKSAMKNETVLIVLQIE